MARTTAWIDRWHEDATLVGTETILRAMSNEAEEPSAAEDPSPPVQPDRRPLLVVPDSRGRVRTCSALRRAGYSRDAIALVSRRTPAAYLDYLRSNSVEALVHGNDHLDLRAALEELAERFDIRTVRVDSAGILNGVLLRSGLVTDVSMLIHPLLVGAHGAPVAVPRCRWWFSWSDPGKDSTQASNSTMGWSGCATRSNPSLAYP